MLLDGGLTVPCTDIELRGEGEHSAVLLLEGGTATTGTSCTHEYYYSYFESVGRFIKTKDWVKFGFFFDLRVNNS